MINYDYIVYNREERDLCAHLFRLLLDDQNEWKPLKKFLGKGEVNNPRIFCEVSIIRDGYVDRRPNIHEYMNEMCELIAELNDVADYMKFENIPTEFKALSKGIFPEKKIKKNIKSSTNSEKIQELIEYCKDNNRVVYGTLQKMFNAKPDLAICEGNNLYVFEAKYDSSFNTIEARDQWDLTKQIALVWQKILYKDLGFENSPDIYVYKLGRQKFNPDVSWEYVYEISKEFLGEDDFTTKVLSKVVK